MHIESTYLAQLDDLVFDVQVGADAEGARVIVLGELIELSADADGRINTLGSHRPTLSLVHADDAGDFGELDRFGRMLEDTDARIPAAGVEMQGEFHQDAFSAVIAGGADELEDAFGGGRHRRI